MLKLKSVIQQLKENDYNTLALQLQENKADKFHVLLTHFRENKLKEEDIAQHLNVNSSAYYTLKSRLYNKIQIFLASNTSTPKVDLLKNIANIPNLIFNSHRDTALAILGKLEKDLTDFDMPYELTNVYSALKKLHLHSPKYYEYTQLYNKHVAYTIALDKADDLLASFHKTLGEYYLSRDKSFLEILWIMKKEMANLSQLYKSHHLTVYQNIINVSFALFVPLPDAIAHDEPVEDILDTTYEIIQSYPKDVRYLYLINVYHFLAFEYYHHLKLYKKEALHYETINANLSSFLLYNFCSFSSKFLLSKIERYIYLNEQRNLYEENQKLAAGYTPDITDIPNYINYIKYKAAGTFYSQKHNESISTLNDLLNNISFKNYTHAEIEIKLFLALSYSMVNKYELAHNLLRSVSRKIREQKIGDEYENAIIFTKMLTIQMDSATKDKENTLLKLKDKFDARNQGNYKILEYLNMNSEFIKTLSKTIK